MDAPDGPVAIVAGSGGLPLQVADALKGARREYRILAFRGFADPGLRRRADAVVDLLDVQGAIARLGAWRPAAVTLVGGVRRPGAAAVLGAAAALRNRGVIADLMARGDDGLLRGVVSLIEEHGHRVIGAHEIAPGLVADPGVLGRHAPDREAGGAIAVGLSLLDALSPYDIGQGVVVAGSRALAVEGPEGTDRMLRRVRSLSARWPFRAPEGGGVLVKAAKRGQDLRVDMPAIGPRTFEEAARAGLKGVAVGAGSTLLLDREEAIRAADRLGLFLVGVATPWGHPS
jgi:DUF1009 family protein